MPNDSARRQLFIRVHNETLSVAAMGISNEDCYRVVGSSVHRNSNGSGGDPVSDDNKLARARFLGCWHIEMSRYETVECDGHAGVVVGPAIEYVSSCVVGDAQERIVCCRLLIVAVSSPLRHAVEKVAGDDVRPARTNPSRCRLDPWRPGRIVVSRRIVNRDEEEVGEKDLAGW